MAVEVERPGAGTPKHVYDQANDISVGQLGHLHVTQGFGSTATTVAIYSPERWLYAKVVEESN